MAGRLVTQSLATPIHSEYGTEDWFMGAGPIKEASKSSSGVPMQSPTWYWPHSAILTE